MSDIRIETGRWGEESEKASIRFIARDVRLVLSSVRPTEQKDKVTTEMSVHVAPDELYDLLGKIAASALAARDEVRRSEGKTYPHKRSDGTVVNVTIPEE